MNIVELIKTQMPDWYVNTGTKENPKLENLKQLILDVMDVQPKAVVDSKSSVEWFLHLGIPRHHVVDPDGWDRRNMVKSWEEEISLEEFMNRLSVSTLYYARGSKLDMLLTEYRTLKSSKQSV